MDIRILDIKVVTILKVAELHWARSVLFPYSVIYTVYGKLACGMVLGNDSGKGNLSKVF